MERSKISKTSRILSVFHLFCRCQEVSFQELTDLMPFCQKTFARDIALLKEAGVLKIRFSKKMGAFVPADGESAVCRQPCPIYADYKPRQTYLEKLNRLTALIRELDGADDPAPWYREHYPTLSSRTMQRDFGELRKIGYRVVYQREEDCFGEHPIGGYYCEFPYGTYELETFERRL